MSVTTPGTAVKVIKATDETCAKYLVGKVGTVVRIHNAQAVGGSIADPLVQVRFPSGEVEAFWKEELEEVQPNGNPQEGR